jgi:CRISPR-associated endonuclease/helicase Cas3
MTHATSFSDWFSTLTTHRTPRGWQQHLALAEGECHDRLIRIPTGLGKTEGILAAWSFHRIGLMNEDWPRRLVWCLPMRVLVEQTEQVARQIADRIPESGRPFVTVLMGGEDSGEWFLHPERPAIVIGTQDMLLSRALNRGYASGRGRWPVEFGLLNQDALWVMDEVQLMDVGLATSAQLQAFREADRGKGLRPCHTWWMSATLQPEWLRSVDTADYHPRWVGSLCEVPAGERSGGLWGVPKPLTLEEIDATDHAAFARRILESHRAALAGEYGRITLVVCNTVDRASRTFDALRAVGRTAGIELVHSRFRPAEREAWRDRFLSRTACTAGVDRIIVATQVVEAGVDISAGRLVTELAPWPSLVQRFGRCARYGGAGAVVVVDRGRDDRSAAPYAPAEMESAWEALQELDGNGVGIAALETFEAALEPEARSRLYPYKPAHLLLRKEFDELFDTTPDLTGADLDISRFIRSGDERDLQVCWIGLENTEAGTPPADYHPHRRELCAVPFLRARDWLCGGETKTDRKPRLRKGVRAWVWDWIDGKWTEATRSSLLPGRVVCVDARNGGYLTDRGFDATSVKPVPDVSPTRIPASRAIVEADAQQDGEQLSFNSWKSIAYHGIEVAEQVGEIARELGIADGLREILEVAALWHDWGKAHPAFQGAMRGADRPDRPDLAKAPAAAWRRPPAMYRYLDDSETRPAFRHELASALGLFAILKAHQPTHPALLGRWAEVLRLLGKAPPDAEHHLHVPPVLDRMLQFSAESFDLLVYLVASHHGKVRGALHAAPADQEYRDQDGRGLPIRGIREGDRLPPVVLVPGEPPVPEVVLSLSPATLGLSESTGTSWRERSLGLLDRYGPGGLAFLEAILRAADVRASRWRTDDPALVAEVPA